MIEYEEESLDIRDKIIVDPDNTYFMMMDSSDMESYGICKENILVIDRTLPPVEGAIVTFFYSGSFYTREYHFLHAALVLRGSTSAADIKVTSLDEVVFFGVVTVVLKNLLPARLRTGRYRDVCSC